MTRVVRGAAEVKAVLLRRRPLGDVRLDEGAIARMRRAFPEVATAAEFVDRVFDEVESEGDRAVVRIAQALDGLPSAGLRVAGEDLAGAPDRLPPQMWEDLGAAAARIRRFHEGTVRKGWFDKKTGLGQIVTPVQRVGVYAPGGTAAYPSSILMTAIPARVAGVEELYICTPPGRDGRVPPASLAAAKIAQADAVFAIGGVQSVAAMAFGTETIPKADKISGPGNLFVVLAMRKAYGLVGMSLLPGPTETLIIADGTADPRSVAADLLAQAEHDTLASPILVTDSEDLAAMVTRQLEVQLASLPRRNIAGESLRNLGGIGVVATLEEAVDLANEYAPEHLCLLVEDPWALAAKVRNSGGVFIGEGSPEVIGDYVAGPSHVMPVGGAARFASPVNVDDFTKITSVFAIPEAESAGLAGLAARLARAEGLEAHARAAELRQHPGPGGAKGGRRRRSTARISRD